jgi:hypothetical protein
MENKAQQKAQELLDKMYFSRKYKEGEDYVPSQAWVHAKQCALIAVDEMINEYKQNSTFAQLEWVDYRIAFLKEVKMELEKL